MLSKKDIVFSLVLIYIFIKLRKIKKIEKMTDISTIKEQINKVYKADVEAIRNLSLIANKLQKGGLTIPGNLKVKGHLIVNKTSAFGTNSGRKLMIRPTRYRDRGTFIEFYNRNKRYGWIMPSFKNILWTSGTIKSSGNVDAGWNLIARNSIISKKKAFVNQEINCGSNIKIKNNGEIHGRDIHARASLNSKGSLNVNGRSYLGGNVGIRRAPHPKVGCIVNGNGMSASIEGEYAVMKAGSGLLAENKRVVLDGDGVRIKNGPNYLNKTGTCCTTASGSSGGAYWKSSHDSDADLKIMKM